MTVRGSGESWSSAHWQELGKLQQTVQDQGRRIQLLEERNWWLINGVIGSLCMMVLQYAPIIVKALGK